MPTPTPTPDLPDGVRLERLRVEHGPALLTFERENRAYFARWVPDRGDAYFAAFPTRHTALLAEQDAGTCHFHVLVGAGEAILGRVNLVDVTDGTAELGYRVSAAVGRRGLATAAVGQVCARAGTEYGLTALWAATAAGNVGSQRVLARNGFVPDLRSGMDGERRFVRDLRG